MPIPYLGSKRRLADKLFRAISQDCGYAATDSPLFVDVFTGGFAMGEYFHSQGWRVLANDADAPVVALLQKATGEGLPDDLGSEFVTRTKFREVRDHPDRFPAWYVGYVRTVWSFGNQGTNYMFGKDVEPTKAAGHALVVDGDPEPLKALAPEQRRYWDRVAQLPREFRRNAVSRVARKYELQQLERLERLERLEHLYGASGPKSAGTYSERLEFLTGDYTAIPPQDAPCVYYLDPPYEGTAEYKQGVFHRKLDAWAESIAETHPVYVSGYGERPDWKLLRAFPIKSTLAATGPNQAVEKLWRV